MGERLAEQREGRWRTHERGSKRLILLLRNRSLFLHQLENEEQANQLTPLVPLPLRSGTD